MERKIGETFTVKGKTYVVEANPFCGYCAFAKYKCHSKQRRDLTGFCSSSERTDGNSVIFRIV